MSDTPETLNWPIFREVRLLHPEVKPLAYFRLCVSKPVTSRDSRDGQSANI